MTEDGQEQYEYMSVDVQEPKENMPRYDRRWGKREEASQVDGQKAQEDKERN